MKIVRMVHEQIGQLMIVMRKESNDDNMCEFKEAALQLSLRLLGWVYCLG